jgi:hypothetical protein
VKSFTLKGRDRSGSTGILARAKSAHRQECLCHQGGDVPMRMTRRRLLQSGGIAALGLGLPRLLAGSPVRADAPANACIFIVQYGGCSHIDSFDLKPDAPEEIRGPYKPIATNVPGIRIGEHLPRLARLADRFTLVRSMSHGNPGHDGGMHVAMTGHSQPKPETPYYGSVAAKLRPAAANVPSYVWLQNASALIWITRLPRASASRHSIRRSKFRPLGCASANSCSNGSMPAASFPRRRTT